MLSPPDTIAILQFLLHISSARTVIDIGTFTGSHVIQRYQLQESVATISMPLSHTALWNVYDTAGLHAGYTALGMALGVPPEGRVYTLDINDDYVKLGEIPSLGALMLSYSRFSGL